MFRKLLVLVVVYLSVLAQEPFLQLFVAVLLLGVFLAYHLVSSPYEHSVCDVAETIALASLLLNQVRACMSRVCFCYVCAHGVFCCCFCVAGLYVTALFVQRPQKCRRTNSRPADFLCRDDVHLRHVVAGGGALCH